MMRKCFFLIGILLLLTSCTKQGKLEEADFGTGTFREPFCGIFASRPVWLCSTLDWPIICKFKPDTVLLTRCFEIAFNEDAVRSKSTVTLFVQGLQNGIEFYCNGKKIGKQGYCINSSTETQLVKLSCKVLPVFPDSLFSGYITAVGKDVDEVNDIKLSTELQEPIACWKLNYEIGWSPIWFIWLTIVLLIGLLIYTLIKVVRLSIISWTKYRMIATHPFLKVEKQYNAKNSLSIRKYFKNRKILKSYMNVVKDIEKILLSKQYPITIKYQKLNELRSVLSNIQDSTMNQKVFNSLKSKTRQALDNLNTVIWGPTPKEGQFGKWCSSSTEHKFILSENSPYYEECEKFGMTECSYDLDGNPNFDKATQKNSIVTIGDLYDNYPIEKLKKRGGGSSFKSSFQDMAQERIANKNIEDIKKYWTISHPDKPFDLYKAYYEWRDHLDLVPHEDGNCQTFRLVKRSVHKAFKHSGGISRSCIVKKYF